MKLSLIPLLVALTLPLYCYSQNSGAIADVTAGSPDTTVTQTADSSSASVAEETSTAGTTPTTSMTSSITLVKAS